MGYSLTHLDPQDYPGYYVCEQEYWDEKKCEKAAKRVFRDGMGTPGGPRGIIQSSGCAVKFYGVQTFNGGTSIDGCWYPGYVRPYPKLVPGYALVSDAAWGTRIVKEAELQPE